MKNSSEKSLLQIANGSGFLFQLRIEDEIDKTVEEHGWEVIDREHAWRDPELGASGYVDLILGKKPQASLIGESLWSVRNVRMLNGSL